MTVIGERCRRTVGGAARDFRALVRATTARRRGRDRLLALTSGQSRRRGRRQESAPVGGISVDQFQFWVVLDIRDIDQLVFGDGITLGADIGLLATATVGSHGVNVPARFEDALDLRAVLTHRVVQATVQHRDLAFILKVGAGLLQFGQIGGHVFDVTLADTLARCVLLVERLGSRLLYCSMSSGGSFGM